MKALWYHVMTLVAAVMIILVWSLYVNPDCRPESPAQMILPNLE